MGKIKTTVFVDEDLWLLAKDKLDMSRGDFIDYALTIYLIEDSEISRLMKKGAKLQSELNQLIGRIQSLEQKNKGIDKDKIYSELMPTVYRIHDALGYIGRNQLRKIATQNELNPTGFIKFVENQENIEVKKYGALPKY